MSALPCGLNLPQSLMRLTDPLDFLAAAVRAQKLTALAVKVERNKPDAARFYGEALILAGADPEDADEAVALFAHLCQHHRQALVEWLNRRAREVVELHELCDSCFGAGCFRCEDYAAMARERSAEDRMEVRCAA